MKKLVVLALVLALFGGMTGMVQAAGSGPSPRYVDCSQTEEVTVQDSGIDLWDAGAYNTETVLNELRDVNTQDYCGHMQVELIYAQFASACHTFSINLREFSPIAQGFPSISVTPGCGQDGVLTKSYPAGSGCYYAHSWVEPFPTSEVSTTPSCV